MDEKFTVPIQKSVSNLKQHVLYNSYFTKPENFADWGPVEIYPPDTELYRQNTSANLVYLLERGLVVLSWLESSGYKMILGLRRKNWLLGAPSVIMESTYVSTALTLTRSYVRRISAQKFLNQLRKDKDLSLYVNWMLSQEINNYLTSMMVLRSMSATDRLKRFLCELILEEDRSELQKPIYLDLPLNYQELAQIIAVTPEHLSRILKKLEQQEIIKRVKEQIVVKAPQALLNEFDIL